MRLLDRILSEGFDCLKRELDRGVSLAMLRVAQLVIIDNVAEYHFQDPKKMANVKASDFPNVMLPFECTFMEMNTRSFNIPGVYEQCGVLMDMIKPDSVLSQQAQDLFAGLKPTYILRGQLFAYCKHGQFQFKRPELVASFGLPVSAEGQILSPTGQLAVIGTVFGPDQDSQTRDTRDLIPFLMSTYVSPCLLALSFMHCRNVKMMTEWPSPKLSWKHQRKTGRPLLKYHVLQIDHMKQVLETEGHASSEGMKAALHICRGHFKTYGRDGKGLLFGKHTGTVWIPMHTRGNMEEGVVVKDYDVK